MKFSQTIKIIEFHIFLRKTTLKTMDSNESYNCKMFAKLQNK